MGVLTMIFLEWYDGGPEYWQMTGREVGTSDTYYRYHTYWPFWIDHDVWVEDAILWSHWFIQDDPRFND